MLESKLHPEYEVDPKSIGIATATLYPDWHPSQTANSISQVRGNIAINFVKEIVSAGYQLAVVDGGSLAEFKSQLAKASSFFPVFKKSSKEVIRFNLQLWLKK